MKKILATCKNPAVLPLRLVVGIIFLAHGSQKLFGAFGGGGIEGTAQFLSGLGFQGIYWAYLVACGEFFGGLLIFVGLLTRLAAINIAVIMLVAIFKVHFANGLIGQGGYEYPLSLLATAVTLLITGGGKYSVDLKIGGECCKH